MDGKQLTPKTSENQIDSGEIVPTREIPEVDLGLTLFIFLKSYLNENK